MCVRIYIHTYMYLYLYISVYFIYIYIYIVIGKFFKIPKRDFIFARVKTGQVGT